MKDADEKYAQDISETFAATFRTLMTEAKRRDICPACAATGFAKLLHLLMDDGHIQHTDNDDGFEVDKHEFRTIGNA